MEGKVTIITGAGSGIGAATAIEFAKKGCFLVLNDINEITLEETGQECKKYLSDDKILKLPGDVTVEEDAFNLITSAVQRFEKINFLINNAGIVIKGALEDTNISDMEKVMQANFVSAFTLIKLAMPYLKINQGAVVNVSSVAAFKTLPRGHSYCSAKAALSMMTKNVAQEVAKYNVRINAVCPGYVNTNLVPKPGHEHWEIFQKRIIPAHALGRIAEPSEIAKPIAFLCSEDASFITGTCLVVDGGLSLNSLGF